MELDRIKRREQLVQSGTLTPIEKATDYFKSHITVCLLDAQNRGVELSLAHCLEEGVEYTHPELLEKACQFLAEIQLIPKAGHRSDAEFSSPSWAGGVGIGELVLIGKLDEYGPIPYRDYQDKIMGELSKVPLPDGTEAEERQCLPLHVGIGLALAADPAAPNEELMVRAADLK